MGKFKKESEKELLFQLHGQFSVNQNDTSTKFVTILVALFVLFGTYGLAYGISIKFISIDGWEISINAVLMLAIIVGFILTSLIILLIYQGYQHRRDQSINNKIRKIYTHPKKYEKLFHGYKGVDKDLCEYIPDYIKIHAILLLILKVVLIASVVSIPNLASSQINVVYSERDSLNDKCVSIINNKTYNDYTVKKEETNPQTIEPYFRPIVNVNIDSNCVNHCTENKRANEVLVFNCALYYATLIILIIGLGLIFWSLRYYHKQYLKQYKSKEPTLSELIKYSKSNTISTEVKTALNVKIIELLTNPKP